MLISASEWCRYISEYGSNAMFKIGAYVYNSVQPITSNQIFDASYCSQSATMFASKPNISNFINQCWSTLVASQTMMLHTFVYAPIRDDVVQKLDDNALSLVRSIQIWVSSAGIVENMTRLIVKIERCLNKFPGRRWLIRPTELMTPVDSLLIRYLLLLPCPI